MNTCAAVTVAGLDDNWIGRGRCICRCMQCGFSHRNPMLLQKTVGQPFVVGNLGYRRMVKTANALCYIGLGDSSISAAVDYKVGLHRRQKLPDGNRQQLYAVCVCFCAQSLRKPCISLQILLLIDQQSLHCTSSTDTVGTTVASFLRRLTSERICHIISSAGFTPQQSMVL